MEESTIKLVKRGVVGDLTTMIPVYGSLVEVCGREFHFSADYFPGTGAVSFIDCDWLNIAAHLFEEKRRDPNAPSTTEVEQALKALIVGLAEGGKG